MYVAGSWRFVHCNWAFISIVGRNTGNWVQVEKQGQQVRNPVKASEGKTIHTVKEDWFLTEPATFIHFCYPKIEKWQLLKAPVSRKRFMALPFIRPAFSDMQLSFKPGQEGTIKSNTGEAEVVIKAPTWNGQLTYELFYKSDGKKEFPDISGADRYVAMMNKNSKEEIRFRVRFPIEGEYKLSLHRKKDFAWICDFKLVCEEKQSYCHPLPETPAIGWGPGVTARKEGIYNTSHNEGIIEARDGRNLEVSFNIKGQQKIRPRLKHATLPDNKMKDFISMSIINKKVTIKLTPDDGEYALLIDSYKAATGQKNVLNYIIEAGKPNRRKEGVREVSYFL